MSPTLILADWPLHSVMQAEESFLAPVHHTSKPCAVHLVHDGHLCLTVGFAGKSAHTLSVPALFMKLCTSTWPQDTVYHCNVVTQSDTLAMLYEHTGYCAEETGRHNEEAPIQLTCMMMSMTLRWSRTGMKSVTPEVRVLSRKAARRRRCQSGSSAGDVSRAEARPGVASITRTSSMEDVHGF